MGMRCWLGCSRIKAPTSRRTTAAGRTPLHTATPNGHEALVRLLEDRGANVLTDDGNGMTPLHAAALSGHEALAWRLTPPSSFASGPVRGVQCRPVAVVRRDGASVYGLPGQCLVPVPGRGVQRRRPVAVGRRDVGASIHEQPSHCLMSAPSLLVQWRPPVAVGRRDVGSSIHEQPASALCSFRAAACSDAYLSSSASETVPRFGVLFMIW